MAPTPSSKSVQSTPSRTPQSKHRLHFNSAKNTPHPSPNPISAIKETLPTEHPVEVISRIRDYADQKEKPISGLNISSDRRSIRVRTEIGYRDFSLDGVSVSEEEGLDVFYKKFIQSRINGVKLGAKCTIMMYGPTGAGKSHTMFGCPKQPGIVYRALRDILSQGDQDIGTPEDDGVQIGLGSFVQVTVLEIYNEEIYDLLSNNNGGGLGLGWPKGNASKVRLEVMGKKAKNATFISGNEAGKISREVAKVEKRRIVKSTLCNDRSSRSHCMIILDVPTVGGRLMLVDMAGSENIEQAGQVGFEAKMQTAKINQGNIALKRVVESIANGDSHVPFRDSKLTMLLQDSFEDDKSKILMVLCASPDPKEMHKTISTLEYGAKAKCIVRGGHTPNKDKITEDSSSAVILGSRIAAMDQFIFKLQMENKRREKEHNEAHKELVKKEEEVAALQSKLASMEGKGPSASEEEINLKVQERTQKMKLELEMKLQECQKMANDFVELGKRRMEEKIRQQQEELEMLRKRLEEIESELCRSKETNGCDRELRASEGGSFAKRLMEVYADGERGMIESMDLDMGDLQPLVIHDVKEVEKGVVEGENFGSHWTSSEEEVVNDADDTFVPKFKEKVYLSTVYEDEGEDKENTEDDEVKKEIVEVSRTNGSNLTPNMKGHSHSEIGRDGWYNSFSQPEEERDPVSARKTRIQNIFMLCGNQREIAQHVGTPIPCRKRLEVGGDVKSVSKDLLSLIPIVSNEQKPVELAQGRSNDIVSSDKENYRPGDIDNHDDLVEVYVKWEASKEHPGKFIAKLKVLNDSSLADLRKQIENHVGEEDCGKQGFIFLMLGDPSGAPVVKEKEGSVRTSKLPICNNQLNVRLACLRPMKVSQQLPNKLPFSSLENKLQIGSNIPSSAFMQHKDSFSPKLGQTLSPVPYVSSGLLR